MVREIGREVREIERENRQRHGYTSSKPLHVQAQRLKKKDEQLILHALILIQMHIKGELSSIFVTCLKALF